MECSNVNINPPVNKGGRPRKYTREELENAVNNYFTDETHKPYSILELCSELNITRETLSEWETEDDKYGLSDVVTRAKYRIAAGWEKAQVHPKIGQFLLQNYMGMSEKSTVEHTGTILHQMAVLPPAERVAQIERAHQALLEAEAVDAEFEVKTGENDSN